MKWFIILLLVAVSVFAQDAAIYTLTYNSSVSNLSLDAFVFTDGKPGLKPILVVMHSYAGTSYDVLDVGQRFASAGILVVAPNMRGRSSNESYELGDDSMYDLFDVYDAITEVVKSFQGDPERVSILGYSGGGANVMQMIQKFPDMFSSGYAFFGIPNYCDGHSWYTDEHYDLTRLNERIGDGNENIFARFPNRCLARNSLKQIPNAKKTKVRLFVDADEEVAPLSYSQGYAWEYQKNGLILNVHLDVSSKDTPVRYTHGYPKDVPDLRAPEQSIALEILQETNNVSLNKKGTLHAGGYVKTKPFTVFVGDEVWEGNVSKGREGLVEVVYDLTAQSFTFKDKSYAPGAKNVTLIWHGGAPREKVSLMLDGVKQKAVADESGDAVFFVDLESLQEKHNLGEIIGVASAIVILLLILVRKKFK